MAFPIDIAVWVGCGPSRRLRKAYAALEVIEQEMERVRHSNPVPCHRPSSCVIISRQLRELSQEHFRLLDRIGRLAGDDETGESERRRRAMPWKKA